MAAMMNRRGKSPTLAAFLDGFADELYQLGAVMPQGPQSLDLTYASLDSVEDMLCSVPPALILQRRVAAYLGATLIHHTQARWDVGKVPPDVDKPCVTRLPVVPRARWYPADTVATFCSLRIPGMLRETTECHDVPKRREDLASLTRHAEGELKVLQDAVQAHAGRTFEDLHSEEYVNAVEIWLSDIIAGAPAREVRRAARDRVVLYLGTLVERATGARWEVCEEPANVDFGHFDIDRWAPMSVVRYIGAIASTGVLWKNLSTILSFRRKHS